jgi:hypothetical protein
MAQRPAQPSVKRPALQPKTKQENASGRPTPEGSLLASRRPPGAATHIGTAVLGSRTTHNKTMAIERWFYHKFHHGLTLADVERYTHLLVGIQFFIIAASVIIAPIYWLSTKPWLRAALLRGDYSDELDDQGRPGANWRPLPPKQKGSKRRKHDYPSFCWDAR